MKTTRKQTFLIPEWSVNIIEYGEDPGHVEGLSFSDVIAYSDFIRKNPIVLAGCRSYGDPFFCGANDFQSQGCMCVEMTVAIVQDATESVLIVESYGWNPETLKMECIEAAERIVQETNDENGNLCFVLDPDSDGRIEETVLFVDADQRTEEALLRYFFSVDPEGLQFLNEEIDNHSDKMADALNAYVLPEIENTYPGIDWSISVGYGEGIFGVFVIGEDKE